MTPLRYVDTAQKRSSIYGLLAFLYLREPGGELISIFRKQDMQIALKNTGIDLENYFQCTGFCELQKELEVEYARLFIGPGKHISPYESVWRDNYGLLWGKATSEVKEFIESLGLTTHHTWTGLVDHVGVELELMKRLTAREKEAREMKDSGKALLCLEKQKEFMEDHILQWVPAFCQKVEEESRVVFYKHVALLTKRFIVYDSAHIKNML